MTSFSNSRGVFARLLPPPLLLTPMSTLLQCQLMWHVSVCRTHEELMELNSELTKSLQMYHDLMKEMPPMPNFKMMTAFPPPVPMGPYSQPASMASMPPVSPCFPPLVPMAPTVSQPLWPACRR